MNKNQKSKKIAIAASIVLLSIGVLLSNAPNKSHKNKKVLNNILVNKNIESKIDKETEGNVSFDDVCKIKVYDNMPKNFTEYQDILKKESDAKKDLLLEAVVLKDKVLINEILKMIKESPQNPRIKEMATKDLFYGGMTNLGKVVLFNGKGKKESITFLYDDQEKWGYITYRNKRYYPEHNFFECLISLKEFSNITSNIEGGQELFNKYNYTPCFKINSIEKTLPKELKYKTGEYPHALYWIYVNELSKAIGLSIEPYLGQKVTCEIYYLKEAFPKEDSYMTRGVLIKHKGKVMGAYIDNGSFEDGKGKNCIALNGKSYKDIKGKRFIEDMQKYVDYENELYKKMAKMSARKVIRTYYNAINDDDDEMRLASMSYESIMDYMSRNRKDKLYSEEFEENYIDYVNILFMRKIEKENDNSMWYDVNFIIKADESKTAYENGFDSWFVNVAKDGECWKMNKMATGF